MKQPAGRSLKYLLAAGFWLLGLFFLTTGAWDIAGCLADPHAPLIGALLASAFLMLFAWVAIAYGLFLFREARADDSVRGNTPGVMEKVHPAEVLGLLVFGLAPVVFVSLNRASREFNHEREAALENIRPAFLRYVADQQRVPRELELLVPQYLPKLPAAIILDESAGPAKRIRYEPMQQTARLHYRTGGWPSHPRYYDIGAGRFVD